MRRPLLLAILALCCTGSPAWSAGVRAWVVADGLELFVEPSGSSYSVGALAEGEAVQVVKEKPGGWLAIEPPRDAYVWVNQAELEILDDQTAIVAAMGASARAGRPGVWLPGPATVVISQGASLRFMEIPPLRVRTRGEPTVLRAVSIPAGLRYYVRADGLRFEGEPKRREASQGQLTPVASRTNLPTAVASIGPAIDASRLESSEASTLRAIEAEHREVLGQAIDRWRLERVRAGYSDLRERVADPQVGAALDARLKLIAHQITASSAARSLEQRLALSRDLDVRLGEAEKAMAARLPEIEAPFDAVGLVQPSSKLVNGARVFALVGADGRTTAYLRFPPGVLRDPMSAQRVGVRGSSRYDETLQARIIDVREMESLGRIP